MEFPSRSPERWERLSGVFVCLNRQLERSPLSPSDCWETFAKIPVGRKFPRMVR